MLVFSYIHTNICQYGILNICQYNIYGRPNIGGFRGNDPIPLDDFRRSDSFEGASPLQPLPQRRQIRTDFAFQINFIQEFGYF